jgi:ATP-dependent Lhr-like helicase
VRKLEKVDETVVLSATDPLNLVGILSPESRVPAIYTNRLLLRDGLPLAALEAGELRRLGPSELSDDQLRALLARRGPRHPAHLHPRIMTGRESKAITNRTVH